MKYRYILSAVTAIVIFCVNIACAQLVSDNNFMQGKFLEVVVAPNGAWGNTVAPPAGYHTFSGGATSGYTDPVTGTAYFGSSTMDFQYDASHDGWATAAAGSVNYYGPYFLPGTPFDGWSVQVNGVRSDAYYYTYGFYNEPGGTLTGTNTTNTNVGGRHIGTWEGTAGPGGLLKIREMNRVDTLSSWDVVTIVFTNTSGATMPGLYYFVNADPDDDEVHAGSFPTNNKIYYQNDYRHRVMAESRPPSIHQDAYSSLCTRDCRAKALIYGSWFSYSGSPVGNNLDQVYAETATSMGTPYTYVLGTFTYDQDIAYGLIYNLGDLAAGDSAIISFAWQFKDSTCTDSAFPDPVLVVNNVEVNTNDTFLACSDMSVSSLPVSVKYGDDKDWSWASWTWSPSTGLSSTTGVTNTVNIGALTGPVTYTVTGNDSITGMHSCNTYVLYFTVVPCFAAVNNGPLCFGDTLRLDATGDSIGATYQWFNPGGTMAGTLHHMVIFPANYSDSGTWVLVRTMGGAHDTARTHVIIHWKPTLTLSSNAPLCFGMVDTLRLFETPDSAGETFSWTGPAGFVSTLANPTLPGYTAADTGIYTVIATSMFGCKDTAKIDAGITSQPPTPVLTGVTSYCSGSPFVPFTVTGYTGTLYWYPSGTGGVGTTTAPTVNTSYGGTYTFWVGQTVGACASLRDSITVKVIVTPAPPTFTGTSTYCQYDTYVAPTAIGSNILWYTAPTGGVGSPTVPIVNTSVPGVTTLYATQSDSGCTSTRGSFVITVHVKPLPPTITGTTVYCQGDVPIPFTLTGVTGTVLWYTAGTGGVGSSTPTPINTATPGVTTYWVSQTNGFCESDRVSISVLVHPTPPAPVITGTASYCQYDTYVPPTATGTNILWYPTATGGSGSSTVPFINTAILGADTIYASQTDSGCISPRGMFIVIVHPTPAMPILSGQHTYCQNDPFIPFSVTSVTATLYWYASGTGGVGSTTAPTVNTAVPGVYSFWVSQSNGFCESSRDSITVIVHPTPAMPVITGKTVYCQQDTFVAPLTTATGTGIIKWFFTAGGVTTSTAPTISTVFPGTVTIYANQTDSGCVSPTDSIVITINPKPLPPNITDSPDYYCPGMPFVPYTIIAGTNVIWYTTDTATIGDTTKPTVNTAIPGMHYVWVTQTVGGCISNKTMVTVTVYDSVIAGFTDQIKLGCNGDSVQFINTSTGANVYEWKFGDGYSIDGTNPLHIYHNQGTFTITLYSRSATCEDSIKHSITLNHPLSASFAIAPSDTICQNTPVTFTSTVSAISPTYLWNFNDGTTATSANALHTYPIHGVYTVSLSVTDYIPCTVTVDRIVTVDTLSGIKLDMTDSVFCKGTFSTFTGLFASFGNNGVIWDFGDGSDTLRNRNPVSYGFDHADSFYVTVIAKYRACPETSARRKILVLPQPQIDLGNDTTICPGGDPILVTDKINNTTAGASWKWNTGQTSPAIYIGAPGVYKATVDLKGCYNTDSIIVSSDCYMNIPNVFTPNGDGVNDYFYPRQYLTKGLTSFKMDIFNRWGQLIFETNTLDGRGWDGKFNDVDQPEGVYIYMIDGIFKDGQKEHHQGNITLLR